MADNQNPSGSSAGGAVTGDNLAQTIAQAVETQVTASLQELTNKLNQISQNLKNTGTNEDTNMEVSTVGNDDAFISLRNERVAHSRLQLIAERVLAAGADHYADLLARSRDHFSSLPPLAPRAASGPGTTGS